MTNHYSILRTIHIYHC